MTDRLRTWVVAALPALVLGAVALWAEGTGSWSRLRVHAAVFPPFGDLRQVTATASCVAADPTWTMLSPPCLAGVPYNYPSIWARAFAALGLTEPTTQYVGRVLMALFVVAVLLIAIVVYRASRSAAQSAMLTAAAVSPPVLLLLERGNIDILVFFLVALSCTALATGRGIVAAVALAVATVAKLFPGGGILGLLAGRGSGRRTVSVLYGVLSTAGLLVVVPELPLIAARTPQEIGTSFGGSVPFLLLGKALGLPAWPLPARLLGVVCFALTVLALLRIAGMARFSPIRSRAYVAARMIRWHPIASPLFLTGSGCFLAAYLMGANWEYRLVFLIPAIGGLGCVVQRGNVCVSSLSIALVAQMWLTYPVPAVIEYLSDLVWLGLAPLLAVFVLAVHRPELLAKAPAPRARRVAVASGAAEA
jgi:hypothetical protein